MNKLHKITVGDLFETKANKYLFVIKITDYTFTGYWLDNGHISVYNVKSVEELVRNNILTVL